MKTVQMVKATGPLAHYARQAKKGPVIVTAGGKPIAAVVPIENTDLETVTLGSDPKFVRLIERSRTRWKREGGISSTEMRRRLRSRL